MAMNPNIPPGLTCDQWYLYLESGYAYSHVHGVMYRRSQVISEAWISTILAPNSYSRKEVAYLLSRKSYYDFEKRAWGLATFVRSPQVLDKIWTTPDVTPPSTGSHLQQKVDLMTRVLEGMNTQSRQNVHPPPSPYLGRAPIYSAVRTVLAKPPKQIKRAEKPEKDETRKVKVVESKQKSRRATAMKEKIRSVPSHLAGSRDFWRTVL
jgi:hypothetical protein